MIEIAHLTSAHERFDVRIFQKQCISISLTNLYSVILIVADGLGDQEWRGIRILDVGKPSSRLDRIFFTPRKILNRVRSLNIKVCHLHDPELLPIALKLKSLKKKVIFDSHEDVSKQILSKYYLSPAIRSSLSFLFSRFEKYVVSRIDAVVSATPSINKRFSSINSNAININNYPLINEFYSSKISSSKNKFQICYVGAISQIRGISQLVEAIELMEEDCQLVIAGKFNDPSLEERVSKLPGWAKVKFLGNLSREEVSQVFNRSSIGIVTFLPEPNHVEAQPNKLFEYMSAGLPVLASDFPLWKDIVEKNECGICVDPTDSKAIARSISKLLNDDAASSRMASNGLRAVSTKYNWSIEEKKLIDLYCSLSN